MIRTLILCLIAIPTSAQTRVLVGANGGSSFGNLFLGPTAAIEVPLGPHFEFDAGDQFSPIEKHIKLGSGWANSASADGIVWATRSLGITGGAQYSNYHTTIGKSAEYADGGLVYRTVIQTMPVRFNFGYVREFNNGISNGVETDHLQSGSFAIQMRVACSGLACYRVNFGFMVGRVLTQSNPICDGTFGTTGGLNNGPCPRGSASAGAFTAGFQVEFPRHRATENQPF